MGYSTAFGHVPPGVPQRPRGRRQQNLRRTRPGAERDCALLLDTFDDWLDADGSAERAAAALPRRTPSATACADCETRWASHRPDRASWPN